MNIVSRLREILSFSGLSVRAFAIKCGITQKTLDNQIKGLRGISVETIMSVLTTFPEISAEWLMRGAGEMFKSETADPNADRVLKLADAIATLQDALTAQKETIAALTERNKQLENQLKK